LTACQPSGQPGGGNNAGGGGGGGNAGDSRPAFDNLLAHLPPRPIDLGSGPSWALDAPDGSASLLLFRDADSPSDYDLALVVEPMPFISAGLDPEALTAREAQDGAIPRRRALDKAPGAEDATPAGVYAALAENHGEILVAGQAYFGLDLGDGNLFLWAKDFNAGDRDMIFALNPAPFTQAGVDPAALEGWELAPQPDGTAEKLLKPFELLPPEA
jgi:hypothetical protein